MRALTPPGRAGVAVYRFESAERAGILACLRSPTGCEADPPVDRPVRMVLQLPGGAQDDVLVVARADRSLEVHAHGAPALAAAISSCFPPTPAGRPSPAQSLLLDALDRSQLALALEQAGYDFGRELALIAALPRAERGSAVAAALERSRVAMAMAQPVAVHLIGRQNVGKSTLFNRLVGHDRVLAGPLAGLTRDAVAETTVLDGYPYTLWDHAGEGPTATLVDADAIARSRRLRASGMRVLLVDAASGPTAADRRMAVEADVVLASRVDLAPASPAWPLDVACDGRFSPQHDDPAALRERIGALLRSRRGLPPAGPVRGFAALDAAEREQLAALAAP